jgi:hypothetical protein
MPDCQFCGAPDAKALRVSNEWSRVCSECEPDFHKVQEKASEFSILEDSPEFSIFSTAYMMEAFMYLDELRESGRTNMFGAAEYLEDEWAPDYFDGRCAIGNGLAKALVFWWMHSFERRMGAREAGG